MVRRPLSFFPKCRRVSKLLINFIGFQAGWFACVLGAANGYPLLGPAVVLAVLSVHLRMSEAPRRELFLLIVAAITGAVFDSALVRTGWLVYPNGLLWSGTAPYWIVAMWPLFATTLNVSLRWLHNRPLLGVLLGATGGPLSYLAGARLGGLEFIDQQAALVYLAIGWGIATPVLVSLAQRMDGIHPTNRIVAEHA